MGSSIDEDGPAQEVFEVAGQSPARRPRHTFFIAWAFAGVRAVLERMRSCKKVLKIQKAVSIMTMVIVRTKNDAQYSNTSRTPKQTVCVYKSCNRRP